MMRRSDVEIQADQFLAFHEKRGQALEDDFGAWAASKDFGTRDRLRIRTAVVERLTGGEAVFTTLDASA